ncbi:MAG TPA: ATP-dependent protease ATPase subunit HslU [Ktedonobacterales bacterium]|jgi:ATP-dependent HslUV protease ATP-binding subunit HslU
MMKDLTPQQIVRELDRYIVGQNAAKRSVAIAMRNRYRRLQLPADLQSEITPKNILMIGPTGVGKTEIARRLARMADAPFIKVEATKFTQVGYVGRDVESIIRDLMETAVGMVHEERVSEVRERAAQAAEKKILDILTARATVDDMADVTVAPVSSRGASITSSSALTTTSASSSNSATPSAAPARRRRPTRKSVAERLARNELDEQMIEIELEPEDAFPSVFEFMAGFAGDEVGGDFQEILSAMPSNSRRRSRQVSVKDARRLLTQEEANKLVDLDEVIEEGTKRVEQSGVVFLDEIDKIAGVKSETGPDVSGEGVQRDLLPIIEGSTVMTRFGPVKTDHVLWITAGAFHNSKPSDLIPELQGRLPLRVELSSLTQDDYVRILTQPENSLVRQFQALLGVEGVSVEFTPDGLEEIARCATMMNERVENIGARRLHTITERVLEDVSFNAPTLSGETVTVDATFVDERLGELLKDEDLSRYIL